MPLHDIGAILDRTDLAALADELCGPRRGHGTAARWPSPVPDHPQTGRTPPVSIFTDRHGRQRWTCWSTGTSGTAIDLVSINQRTNISAAIAWLADRAGHQPAPITPTPARTNPPPTEPSTALRDYIDACRAELHTPSGAIARRWLANRRLDPDIIDLNNVGYDPGPHTLRRARGLPQRGPGIVLPSFDQHGQLVYAQTRYLDPDTTGRKYDNPSSRHATRPAVSWPRHQHRRGSITIVCEGVIDALTIAGLAIRSAAILSANDTGKALHELARAPHPLVLALDPDPVGTAATNRLLTGLRDLDRHDDRALALSTDINELATTHGPHLATLLRTAIRGSAQARQPSHQR